MPTTPPSVPKIVIVGGWASPETMEVYVPGHPEMSYLSNATRKLDSHYLAAGYLDGHIVAAAGFRGSVKNTETEEFISSENQWKIINNLKMHWASLAPAYATHNDMLYVFGGYASDVKTVLAKSQRLNWKKQVWEAIAPMLTPRVHAAATVTDDFIYVAGGAPYWATAPTLAFEKYNPKSNLWTNLKVMPSRRHGLALAVLDDYIYACGGWNGKVYLNTCDKYNINTNTWHSAPATNYQHCFHQIVVIEGKMFSIGGVDGRGDRTVEEFDPAVNNWVYDPKKNPPLKIGRSGAAVFVM